MSNFINTTRTNIINSLVEGQKKRLENPYYVNMKNPTICTYYSIDSNSSTLDIGSKLSYADVGNNAPFKYNKIKNFYIFGIDRLITQFDNGEYGLESDAVETDAFVLPNTIIPVPNDYIEINYLDKKVLFRVSLANPDMLDDGANFYQLRMKLDQPDRSIIDQNINKEFDFIVNNVGSQLNTIIKSDEYNFIQLVEDTSYSLKSYYKDLFYNSRVDSFILGLNNYYNLYDPYLIEFIIRNNIMKNNEFYMYINQKTATPSNFIIDYDKSFFRALEKNKLIDNLLYMGVADLIEDPLSILNQRQESYYKLNYADIQNYYSEPIICIDEELINNIKNKTLYDNDYKNIIIKYFINEPINKSDIDLIENISFIPDKELFYNIPILIFILEKQILGLLKK